MIQKKSKFLCMIQDRRLFEIFILGILSGMPLAIIYTSLVAWLTESAISLETITTFAVTRIAYSLKPLWSPIIDYFTIPVFEKFGSRKSWMIFCYCSMAFILYLMSLLSPANSLSLLYLIVISFGILSATFDISFDAFRIERLEEELQGMGAAYAVFGYRIGMLLTGGGALYLAHVINWSQTFLIIAGVFVISTIFIFFVNETIYCSRNDNISWKDLAKVIINPFRDFFSRESALTILFAIIFFKLGEAMLGVVSMPFYYKLGFSKEQIAIAVKFYGLIATICGGYAGGFVIYKIGQFKGLLICALLQAVTNLAFVWLNHQQGEISALFIAISIENFAGGMGSAALVAYLSNLCNRKYSASQYSLFSSAAGLFNNTVTIYGGTLVKYLGWDYFFILTIILCLPGILLLSLLQKKYSEN